MTERRRVRRYDLRLPVIIRIPGRKAVLRNGYTKDVSSRGVYFVLDNDGNVNGLLDMTMKLLANLPSRRAVFVNLVSRIVRVEKLREGSNKCIGVAAVIERYDIVRDESIVS